MNADELWARLLDKLEEDGVDAASWVDARCYAAADWHDSQPRVTEVYRHPGDEDPVRTSVKKA